MVRMWFAAFATVAVAVVSPAAASADGGDGGGGRGFTIGARPVWFVTGGATGGYTTADGEHGAFVGGELSLVRLRERRFVGLYADGYYDFVADATCLTLGPELGWIRRSRTMPIALGIDGGGALRLGDGDAHVGATGRLFVAMLGSVAFYGRYTYFDGDDDAAGDHVVQVGMTLKFPLGPPFGAGTR